MSVDYEVGGIINPVDMGDAALCWLATTATLMSWSNLKLMGLSETASQLGSPFTQYLTSGDSLPAAQVPLFLQRSKLVSLPGQSRTAKAWEDLLRAHGPLGVGVDADDPNNYMAHLVTMYGISGDGTPQGTLVKLIDPSGGEKLTVTFKEFGELYGASDAVNTLFNVFHNH